jgi:hypothetical protein
MDHFTVPRHAHNSTLLSLKGASQEVLALAMSTLVRILEIQDNM